MNRSLPERSPRLLTAPAGPFRAGGLVLCLPQIKGQHERPMIGSELKLFRCGIEPEQLLRRALCSVNIYVRRGALLKPAAELLGAGVSVGDAAPPAIEMYGLGGTVRMLKWDGQAFR